MKKIYHCFFISFFAFTYLTPYQLKGQGFLAGSYFKENASNLSKIEGIRSEKMQYKNFFYGTLRQSWVQELELTTGEGFACVLILKTKENCYIEVIGSYADLVKKDILGLYGRECKYYPTNDDGVFLTIGTNNKLIQTSFGEAENSNSTYIDLNMVQNQNENLEGKELPELIKIIKNNVYIIEVEK